MLLDPKAGVLVQGITGREASRMVEDSLAYGSNIVAGVTPGRGGQRVHGIPVYDTVAAAVEETPGDYQHYFCPTARCA